MEPIRNILQMQFKEYAEATTSPIQDSKNLSYKISGLEVVKDKWDSIDPMPKPEKCKYCGKILYHIGVKHPFLKHTVWKWLGPERCTCIKAKKYWADCDAEQERIRKEREEAEAKKRMQERIQKLLRDSGIKERFKDRNFDNFEVNEINKDSFTIAHEYAKRFAEYQKKGEGLYFVGNFGTGKTHLAVAISLYLISKGTPVICKTLIDLLGIIKNTFDYDNGIKEHDILNLYDTVDLLVVDDLGKEIPTDWTLSTFYSILNERYETCKPVIITTNYNDNELLARLSKNGDKKTAGAIISRLHEMCYQVEMNWKDRRSENA